MATNFAICFAVSILLMLLILLLRSFEHHSITATIREHAPGKFIPLSRGYTHYEIAGPENGTVVILIHGFSVPY